MMRINFVIFVHFIIFNIGWTRYKPTWESIDSRPIPSWYQSAKLGIFCHWGVYSVPAFRSEWFWWYWKGPNPDHDLVEHVKNFYKPNISYADFAIDFTAELFDPGYFKDVVEASGARYFVFTSKHHEGFTMWPSKTSWNWNSLDTGPHRDIIRDLKNAFSTSKISFGLYFSQFEFFNPYFMEDKSKNSTNYVELVSYPQMLELVEKYVPEIIWSDGDWDMSDEYWKSKEFISWLYNDSPIKDVVVVNDRWGAGIMGKHGGFLTFSDHFDPGHLVPRKWENCITLDAYSWGYRRNIKSTEVRPLIELVEQLVKTIACNGNLLLNFGPDEHGIIPAIFEERLRQLGEWVHRNQEAIFDTYPWMYQNDTMDIWYTVKPPSTYLSDSNAAWLPHINGSKLYAFFLKFPHSRAVVLPSVIYTEKTKAFAFADDGRKELNVIKSKKGKVIIDLKHHQYLFAYNQFVVELINYEANFHDPIRFLKKKGLLDVNGRPRRMKKTKSF